MAAFQLKGDMEFFVCVTLIVSFQIGTLVSCKNQDPSTYAVVTASEGTIVGEVVKETAIFWGVPFSQPPIGEWRWREPRNPLPYAGKYWNATYSRPGCAQICNKLLMKFACAPINSEDCLYLNIWVPRKLLIKSEGTPAFVDNHYVVDENYKKRNADSLAVMFYIHGGAFIFGAGSVKLYDGRFLASRQDVIVVTTNYRLGVMGFLTQDNDNSANFGIQDQIRALKWIKKNIAEFGGNPSKITVVGESAGAESVAILMTSPYAKGLFQRAIIQSEPWSLPYRTVPEAKKLGDKLAKEVRCTPRNMKCLRSISTKKILKAGEKVGAFNLLSLMHVFSNFQMFAPVIDGDLIPRLPFVSFTEGKYYRMPVIMGNDRNEGYSFVFGEFKRSVRWAKYDIIMLLLTGEHVFSMLKQYPPGCIIFCDNRPQLSKFLTDYAFICPNRKVLFEQGEGAWGYLFNASLPSQTPDKNDICKNDVCHGSEIPYIFDTVLLTHNYAFDPSQQRLSDKMQRYWGNFVKYGNPNGKEVTSGSSIEHWERFTDGNVDSYQLLRMSTEGNVVLPDPFDATCDYWDKLNVYGKL